MQHHSLPANNLYGNKPVDIFFPDNWKINVCTYKGANSRAMRHEEIKKALCENTSVARISEIARNCKNAAIIFDDITRPTPVGQIAEVVLEELHLAGLKKENIRFIAAVGCHRAMSREDYVRKLGENIVQNYKVYSHNPFFGNKYVGTTSHGVDIHLNACAATSDFKIGIGTIFPHGATGIGGGSKLICPGIAGFDSIKAQHGMQRGRWNENLDSRDNAKQAAELLGVNLIIDALLNGQGEIAELIVDSPGKVIDAHVERIRSFYTTNDYEKADLVIANNYFKPTEVSVAINGTGVMKAINNGGDLIVSSHTPQGTANHYLFGAWGNDIDMTSGAEDPKIPGHIGRYIAFSKHLDMGTGQGWHPTFDRRFYWASTWSQVMKIIGKRKRSVLIFDYATAGFYKSNGNG